MPRHQARDRAPIAWSWFVVGLFVAALASPAVAQSVLDRDGDGLPDAWEVQFGLNPGLATGDDGAQADLDGDGRTNYQEYLAGTHPRGLVARYFAEGATGPMFDCRFALFNPTMNPSHAQLRFLRADGVTITHFVTLAPQARATVNPEGIAGLDNAAFSTVVEADTFIVADRLMEWDTTRYGSHAETGVPSPAFTWYLAEGATHSGFDLFYLFSNPSDAQAQVTVTYLLPTGAPIARTYDVGPRSRFNVWVNREAPILASTDVSAVVTATVPIVVERAMYLSAGGKLFNAGHDSAGVTAPSPRWFLAEGATGDYFDLFVLMANPTDTAATVDATYLLPDGTTVARTYTVGPYSRFTVWVDQEDPLLANTSVATKIQTRNDTPIIVERAMWWPGTPATWNEAHNSPGATASATAWALAEGEDGGLASAETYVLVANTSDRAGDVMFSVYFEGGGSQSKTVRVAANSRYTINVSDEFPDARGRRFSVRVTSVGTAPVELVVERAMYEGMDGNPWASGTNALGARLPLDGMIGNQLSDLPVVTIEATDAWSREPGTDGATLTFRRTGDLAPLTVAYSLAGAVTNGTDIATLPGTVSFAAGVDTVVVAVTPLDDTVAESPETLIVTLYGGMTYAAGLNATAQIILLDNDVPPVPASLSDAARFLTQATFGPTLPEIDRVQSMGYEAWLAEQFAAPPSSFVGFLNGITGETVDEPHLQEAWMTHAMVGPDQLRQRVANALLEIMVVSDHNGLEGASYALAAYMDVLMANAFGTYRQLLEQVTLNPAMGKYLDMLKNRKEDPKTGRRPNENYAREVLQLFSIGVFELNLDGTLKLDQAGVPIPTYTEEEVAGLSKVFTGWTYYQTVQPYKFSSAPKDWLHPMMAIASEHSTVEKPLLDGVVLPAGQTPEKDLADALDLIANHPNVGPFISRQLIQRLVTGNPTRGYIQRVATVFNNNGNGVRGDLGAVVKAILLDPEARNLALSRESTWGKQREPMIRFVSLARAFTARATSGKFAVWNLQKDMGQGPFRSPSVFNFFEPNYQPPGLLRDLGIYAPEFQITTESAVVTSANTLRSLINGWYGWPKEDQLKLNLAAEIALAPTPELLIERLNRLLFAGGMSNELKTITLDMLGALRTRTPDARVKAAILLLTRSPESVIQK